MRRSALASVILLLLALQPAMAGLTVSGVTASSKGFEINVFGDYRHGGRGIELQHAVVNDSRLPVQIDDASFSQIYASVDEDLIEISDIGLYYSCSLQTDIVAFDITYILLDLYGRPLEKVVVANVGNMEQIWIIDGTAHLTSLGLYEYMNVGASVAYISAVRTSEGGIQFADEDAVLEAVGFPCLGDVGVTRIPSSQISLFPAPPSPRD